MNIEKSQRLFLGSFLTLIAAGMGFSARGAVLGLWGAEYGFTRAELGVITGPNSLLGLFTTTGLDGSKVAAVSDKGAQLEQDLAIIQKRGKTDEHLRHLSAWWESVRPNAVQDGAAVAQATLYGSRMALPCTAMVPACMAIGYLLLIRYFRSKGGYAEIHLETQTRPGTGEPVVAQSR